MSRTFTFQSDSIIRDFTFLSSSEIKLFTFQSDSIIRIEECSKIALSNIIYISI